jgi:hypothetical protein
MYTIYTMIAMIFSFTIVTIFHCVPVDRSWDILGPTGALRPDTCVNYYAFQMSVAAFSIAADVFIWILPLPMLLREFDQVSGMQTTNITGMRIAWQQKVAMILTFSLGAV